LENFTTLITSRTVDWMKYCHTGWESSGRPDRLAPPRLYDEPEAYGDAAYVWLEMRYENDFHAAFRLARTAIESTMHGKEFRRLWTTYFDIWSLWKQLIPLFAFSSAFDGVTSSQISLAAAYIVGQGVPSKAVDDSLDRIDVLGHQSGLLELSPFCLISYATALEMIRDLALPAEIQAIFLRNSCAMYALMWREFADRFTFPEQVSAEQLTSYIHTESRLLSSVFYGITIEWAFVLAHKQLGPAGKAACRSLRRVRQLNDEIIDSEEDLVNGILTYPMLYALSLPEHGARMGRLLKDAWHAGGHSAVRASTIDDFRNIMLQTDAFAATANVSFDQLFCAMQFTMESFAAERAFPISLLINQRLAVLLKRARNGWAHVPDQYRPRIAALNIDDGLNVIRA
jgi:hypothetical protein